MMRRSLFAMLVMLVTATLYGQPYSGIISSSRATTAWSTAGLAGSTPDVPPDASWTQCGSTIAAYGSSGSPGSTSTIQTALSGCSANHYVLLGTGSFYLTGTLTCPSSVALRGAGPNLTHIFVEGLGTCFAASSFLCVEGSTTYNGSCLRRIERNSPRSTYPDLPQRC